MPVTVHCWTKASPIARHLIRSSSSCYWSPCEDHRSTEPDDILQVCLFEYKYEYVAYKYTLFFWGQLGKSSV